MILAAAQLTPSGRPVLQQGEIEVSLLDKVDLELQPDGGLAGQQAESYKNGYAILTTRRIIWVEAGGDDRQPVAPAPSPASSAGGAPGGVRAASLPLAAVVACYKKVQYSIKGAKVRLMLEVYTDLQREPVPASSFHTNVDLLGLRCRGPAPDTFKALLEEQVRQAVAADSAAAATQTPRPAGVMSSGGSLGGGIATGAVSQLPLNPVLSPLRAGLQLSPRTSEGPVWAGGVAAGAAAPTGSAPSSGIGGASGIGVGAQKRGAEARPDPELWQQLVEMGFPRNRCARSLVATQNKGPQEAIDYLLAFGDQPGMDDPLEPPPATRPTASSQPGAAPWGMASPSLPPFDTPSHLYPAILPSSGPPAGSLASPYTDPYSPQSAASAALSPYGAVLYGGVISSVGAVSPAGGGTSPGAAAALQPFMQKHMSMRPYPHLYGSAPELGGSGGSSPALSRLAAAPSGSLDVGVEPARAIGVAGIVKREQQKTAESGRAVEQAFRDLSALMSSAAAMVVLAEKFRGVLGADTVGPVGTGGEDPLLMDLETQQQLIALGISSPVTRETAGARYHIELSRQLADFLANPLQRVGGLMSLPDVYCLFNRARGTELVSPDDLLQAAKLFARAGVQGLRLRHLSSGVLVIQGPQHSEEQVCSKIAQMTSPLPPSSDGFGVPPARGSFVSAPPPLGPGLSASDVALALGGISVAISAEHLLMAEARGVVCRDDGPEGLRFYRNFFQQDQLDPASIMIS